MREQNCDALSARELNEILIDKERALNLFRVVAKRVAHLNAESTGNAELDAAVNWVADEITVSGGESNINQVFMYAESPIERAFLNSFLFKMSIEDALGVQVYGPVEDLDTHIEYVVSEYQGLVEWLACFFHYRGERQLSAAYAELDRWLHAGKMPESSYHWAVHMLGANGLVDYVNAFHVMIQPTMKLKGRTIRPDLAIWVPADPNVKILVECDGFACHSDSTAFQRDRARDRQLMEAGYRVRRYAGAEIYQNPLETGRELVDFLNGLSLNHQPKLLDAVMERLYLLERELPPE
jgi:hypothetical protein